MSMTGTPRGVRKVSELITQKGRSLIVAEEDDAQLDWAEIPDGTLKINPKTGVLSVKLEGETSWVPAGLKNDGTICIAKDSRYIYEIFTVKTTSNGDGTFTYVNEDGNERKMPITSEGYHVFQVEKGSYVQNRNCIEAIINDTFHRSAASNGLIELDEHRFALTEELYAGQEVTAKYLVRFNIGNPYPRFFLSTKKPVGAEAGDFWLDLNPSPHP